MQCKMPFRKEREHFRTCQMEMAAARSQANATLVTDRNISISVGGTGCSIGLVGCLKTNMGDNNIKQKKKILVRIQVLVITILLFME